MVFIRYFFKRFFGYFLVLAFSITFILTFIEFFEKIMRVSHVKVSTILEFLWLNTLPTLLDIFPMAAWLATLFFIREFIQYNQWETLEILGIGPRQTTPLFLYVGSILALVSLTSKDILFSQFYSRAETFKQEHFKQISPHRIYNRWFAPNTKTFCFIGEIDFGTGQGKDYIQIRLSDNFMLHTTLIARSMHLSDDKKSIHLQGVQRLEPEDSKPRSEDHMRLDIPGFYDHLRTQVQHTTLPLLIGIATSGSLLTTQRWYHVIGEIIGRISWHLQLLIYPLLTFLLFCCFYHVHALRWIPSIALYPSTTIITTLFASLSKAYSMPLLASGGYFLLMLFTFFLAIIVQKRARVRAYEQ